MATDAALRLRAAAALELRRRNAHIKNLFPDRLEPHWDAMPTWGVTLRQPYRYKVLYGGRGAGKSFAVADALLLEGAARKCRILCAREFQNSIKESVHFLLKERIYALGLEDFYKVLETTIVGQNGTSFVFKGIRHNVQSIKSMAGLTHCWIEEGQTISAGSWQILVPTIREEGSEIWVTFNPHQSTDPIYQEFVSSQRQNAYVRKVNWDENPWFPETLDEERRVMQASDPSLYAHIWEGECWERSDAQVLSGKWSVEEFEPGADWDGPYHGADFGFAQDPTTLHRYWVHDGKLYAEYESYAVGLELDHTADRWKADVPGCEQHVVRADSARPESISYLRRHGIPKIEGVKKWAGSVEDGVAHLRSYTQIAIHPRCSHLIEEARLWSYKVDRLTGDVLPTLVDAYNHGWDDCRYALSPLIRYHPPTAMAQSVAVWG
jgi:phage terminase large subunit